jgi:uncharacterized membrane protein YkvA (DUF1232 family)
MLRAMDLGWLVGIVVALAVLWTALLVMFWALRPRDVPTRELLRVVPDLVRLLRALITDRTVAIDVRIALLGTLVWIISPIDPVPEFLPVVGQLDDVIVAVAALRFTRHRLGLAPIRERWPGTDDGFALLVRVMGAG